MQAMRRLVIGSVLSIMTAAAAIGQAAPAPGAASLTVDQQVHLGTDGALVKEGSLLLWEGSTNIGIGRSALSSNTAGTSNTAVGSLALTSNTVGTFNTAVGDIALQSNYDGERNTAVGGFALANNVDGSYNTAIGLAAMEYNISGSSNTALGAGALALNIGSDPATYYGGNGNTAVGRNALLANTYGETNTAVGYGALRSNEDGHTNTALGNHALQSNTTGGVNTAIGNFALGSNLTGSENVAIGSGALLSSQYGSNNTAVGGEALMNSSGVHSAGLGYGAGKNATTGNHNIFIANDGNAADANLIRIGMPFADQGDGDPTNDTGQNKTFIAGIATAAGDTFLVDVCIDPITDQLGPCPLPESSRRFKEEIQDIGRVSEKLMLLRPVRFLFKVEHARGDRSVQYGLIAEEVAEVFPQLAVYGEDGTPRSVKYHLLSSLLLNELQKQEQRLVEQSREVLALKAVVSELEDMKTRLARLEASPARSPRVANHVDERGRRLAPSDDAEPGVGEPSS